MNTKVGLPFKSLLSWSFSHSATVAGYEHEQVSWSEWIFAFKWHQDNYIFPSMKTIEERKLEDTIYDVDIPLAVVLVKNIALESTWFYGFCLLYRSSKEPMPSYDNKTKNLVSEAMMATNIPRAFNFSATWSFGLCEYANAVRTSFP